MQFRGLIQIGLFKARIFSHRYIICDCKILKSKKMFEKCVLRDIVKNIKYNKESLYKANKASQKKTFNINILKNSITLFCKQNRYWIIIYDKI